MDYKVKTYPMKDTVSKWLRRYLRSGYESRLGLFDDIFKLHNHYRKAGRLSGLMTACEFAEEFILDAWAGLERVYVPEGAEVADAGSGGGYPGIPWSVFRPDLRVTLIESNARKAEYLKYVVRELGLLGVDVRNARTEEVNERYDVVTAKGLGVNSLAVLAALVKPGGRVVVFTSLNVDIPLLKGPLGLERVEDYVLPYRGTKRVIAVYGLRDVSRETFPVAD
jgi:16S rRNA (guanine(527)-N(7))-methyltransferase RsmG